ncbi:tRNA (guanine-N7)-methyltransferase [Thioclava dalianensis]|uniref:tRNA (guanine-N(7)-)-methyltransferase n=1 Tax=Thioclava dalianensis TaxID=1185766 RepID=A0A074U5I4_9RHOB|nr:tRNA (guanine(46)-N(7))-methyltransferase TrmB [Thioclava dalianensis]KEP69897.1 tRNA (guanine-N7)-methyltransferase [Thioclava dalianensis]SFN16987.1 tRNA (guanine-N7-)-methyltransferase [Thioclava dalianensis]
MSTHDDTSRPDDDAAPDAASDGAPWRNFYGRRHGKTLNKAQKDYLREDLAALSPGKVGWDVNPDRVPLDLAARFGGKPVWLEVGFGGGEHLVHMAKTYPDVAIIGCEPYINGVAMLLGKIRRAGVDNVAVHPGDARDLMDVLPEGSIEKAFLLYPDPWPKSKHHRRRFVTQEHLVPLHRALVPGAPFRIATDIPDYVRQAVEEVPKAGFEARFDVPAAFDPDDPQPVAGDWDRAWDDWLSTRYEQKALREGRKPHYLSYRRI